MRGSFLDFTNKKRAELLSNEKESLPVLKGEN
jgi:hypothetical protein